MIKVVELRGKAHVFTLSDGKTFRIFARQTKELSLSLVSNEMRLAESMGIIALIQEETPDEVKSTNKSKGGK